MPVEIDAVDLRILERLQTDASISIADLAEHVGLSSSPCWRRIKRLEDEGVITARVTLLDREILGLGFEAFAMVKLQVATRENLERFTRAARDWPEATECAAVTGPGDVLLRVVTTDLRAYDAFLRDKVLALGIVADVQSSIVVHAAKRSTAAPLRLAATNPA